MNQDTPVYFQLNPDLKLRGWLDIRHALQGRTGMLHILPQAAVDAIELSWTGIPANYPIMLPAQQEALRFLVKHDAGKYLDRCVEPLPEQRYRQAPCNAVVSIHWSITGRCNLKCRHCFVEAPDAAYGELSLAECIDIMDQMNEANIASVSLTGGEPLVRPDWWEFYRSLQERQIAVSCIYTNGLLVTEKWLDQFAEIEPEKIGFSLSFDGIGHHDWLRGREGMERHAIDAISLLVGRGYPVEIETALYKDNLGSIPDTCALLHQLGIRAWKLSGMSASGAWLDYAAEHSASGNELSQCYVKTLNRFQELGRPFSLQMDHRYACTKAGEKGCSPAVHGDGSEQALKRPVCSCARLHPYLLPDATLMPCMPLANCGLDGRMPNLKENRLTEILKRGTEFFDFISITPEELFQRQEKGKCASCEHRSQCCGGCRAKAYGAGDLFGADPDACDFFKNGTKRIFEPYY